MAGTISATAGEYLRGLGQLCGRLDAAAVERLADQIFEAWVDDRQVIVFGNGGSASTAGHFVTDLVKTACVEGQRRLRAISLVDNYGLTTALGNDVAYDQTLAFPLETYARPGDLAIAISASGNSPNVVNACLWAKAHGVKLAGLTGCDGGRVAQLVETHINVPSDNFGFIEDLHLSINHMVSQILKARVTAHAAANRAHRGQPA